MAISASDIVNTICAKIGIPRDSDATAQFMSKQELLQVLAFIDKQEIHIDSLKREVDEFRTMKAHLAAMTLATSQELAHE